MDNDVASTFLDVCARRMRKSGADIARCCDQLSEEQMWRRGGEYENSVANLLLHLEGNMRQWIMHGVAGQPDVRERDAEFALEPGMEAGVARERFQSALEEARAVIVAVPHERLLEVIDPQPTGVMRHPTVLEAIFQVASHVREHTGQIILLTKQMLARDLDLSMPRKR
jgi:uncharacterized damage-inducible protein DinB